METLQFGKSKGRSIEAHGSVGTTVVHLLRRSPVSVVTIYLEPGGLLGRHPAAADQLFLVVAGNGQAAAGKESCQLSPGTAVLWRQGEEHETRAGEGGLTAVVIEGEGLAKALIAGEGSGAERG